MYVVASDPYGSVLAGVPTGGPVDVALGHGAAPSGDDRAVAGADRGVDPFAGGCHGLEHGRHDDVHRHVDLASQYRANPGCI